MITQEKLKEILEYDSYTGLFTFRVKLANRVNIGDVAGCLNSAGYVVITLDYKVYYAHRLAIFYTTGVWPYKVDHRDTIKHHNWISNLRVCNTTQNGQNQRKAQKHNKSTGLLGSHKTSYDSNNYKAVITINGKQKYLGVFNTPEEAHERYLEEKRKNHEFNTL